jgi:hypothetical protein
VTSRNRFSSVSEYIRSTTRWSIASTAACSDPSCSFTSSGCSGRLEVRYLEKMSFADSASGRSILILTSRRPGRRIAGSIMSSRLEAPMTMTFSSPSTPSISDSSWGTMVFSTSEETPEPRVRKIESISSKNTITGMPSEAFSRARWKTRRMCRSVSPTYLFSSSGPLMFRK